MCLKLDQQRLYVTASCVNRQPEATRNLLHGEAFGKEGEYLEFALGETRVADI